MHINKNWKFLIAISYSFLFVCFIGIILYSYYAMKADSVINPPNKTLNILTWKHIPTSILDGFQKTYPDYTLNIERYSKNNYLSFLKTKLSSDSSVDIVEIPSAFYSDFVEKEYLEPLADEKFLFRFTDESLDFLKSLSDSKEVYGIPYQSDYICLWYNKALFQKYNIGIPDTPKHLIEACEKLIQQGIPPLAAGLAEPDTAQSLLSALTAQSYMDGFNSYRVSPEAFADIDNSDYMDSITSAYNFKSKGYISTASSAMNEKQAFQAFLDNQYGMAFTGESASALLTDSTLQKIDIDVTGLYVETQDASRMAIGSPADSVLSVYKGSSSKDISRKFLDYFTQYDTVDTYSEETNVTTNIQDYTISNELSASVSMIKTSPAFVYWKYFYISPFMSDHEQRNSAQRLFYNMITPEQYTKIIQQGD